MTKYLRIDSSARKAGSVTRELTDRYLAAVPAKHITHRDVSEGLPFVTEDWVGANFTPAEQRSDAQKEILSFSDSLVAEIAAADEIVIGLPIYNFGVPAALKAWVDMVARAGLTFKYTENGPVGLLSGKRAILLVASGGTKAGSEIDFATGYMRHALGFIGITDVTLIAADGGGMDATAKPRAEAEIDALLAA